MKSTSSGIARTTPADARTQPAHNQTRVVCKCGQIYLDRETHYCSPEWLAGQN